MYFKIALGYCRFFTLSDTPRISPAYRTKYYRSASSHLFVSCANRTFYCENYSSKSKSYNEGFASYFNTGRNTPGYRPEIN